MAKKRAAKPARKVKIQLTLSPEIAQKLRIAALHHDQDISEFVSAWITKEYSSIHIRFTPPGEVKNTVTRAEQGPP